MSKNRCPYCSGVVEAFRQADDFTEAGKCIYVTRYRCEDCGVVDVPESCGHPNHGNADHDCKPFVPPCGSCGEPGPYTITRQGEPTPACLRHLNHWRNPFGGHGFGDTADCLCGRNFTTVRGLREHITKARANGKASGSSR